MLDQLEELKAELEAENFGPINDFEVIYLEQIRTKADITNFSMAASEADKDLLRSLSYSVAVRMGYTEAEAAAIAWPAPVIEPVVKIDEAKLAAEYDSLCRSYSASMSCLQDAEYALVEEISAEGFASKKTRRTKEHYEAEAQADLAKLNSFKSENAALVRKINAERSEANHKAMWNS